MEKQLRRDASTNLSESLLVERQKNIQHLHDYWTKEEFPKNTKYPGKILPNIKDDYGTPCAMAYIIEKSGQPKLVEELQTTNNLVYIEDVKEGPLIHWINHSGLTKKETEQIQPTYCGYVCKVFSEYGFILYPLILGAVSIGLGSLGFKIIKKRNLNKPKRIIAYSLIGIGSVIVGIFSTIIIVSITSGVQFGY